MEQITISLETYNQLLEKRINYEKLGNEYLKQIGAINSLKQALMEKHLKTYILGANTLEYCLNDNYALDGRDTLYRCGITYDEMQGFIRISWKIEQSKKEATDGE